MNQYNIVEFGAVADGVTNNAAAIQKAIDAASANAALESNACSKLEIPEAGTAGGRVVVPAGRFLSGTLTLRSNVDLHLEKGAVLISSLEEADILEFAKLFEDDNQDTGWDGGCFLFAKDAENITISGEGVIYGQGDQVFFDDDTDGGFHECPMNVTAFRPRLTFFENVENLTIKEITIRNSAFWTLHMAGCRSVLVQSVHILNDIRGANNDGIDPDCCQDVMIRDCMVRTGDDAIVIKSTKPMAARYGSCENILISSCILHSRDSALKIGTETYGDIRNVILSDCVVKDCSRGIGIWVRDGATIEDIHIHHLTGNVLKYADSVRTSGPTMWWGNGEPIFIDAAYRSAEKNHPGTIRNITFDHIYLKAESSVFIAGEAAAPIQNVRITELQLTMCKQGTQPSGFFDEQPSVHHVYAHEIPAVYVRSAENVSVMGQVHFEVPYSREKNKICIVQDSSNVNIGVVER